MKKTVLRLSDRLFVVFFALLFLQLPLFIAQYEQQLAGRVEELRWEVKDMERAAGKGGKTLGAYIDKFRKNEDREIAMQGGMMATIEKRYGRLSQGLYALQHGSPWTRTFKFLYYSQGDVALSTLKNFTPGIPFSFEGLIYALIGMGCGVFLFHLLCNRLIVD